jgi:hypothetical protein
VGPGSSLGWGEGCSNDSSVLDVVGAAEAGVRRALSRLVQRVAGKVEQPAAAALDGGDLVFEMGREPASLRRLPWQHRQQSRVAFLAQWRRVTSGFADVTPSTGSATSQIRRP